MTIIIRPFAEWDIKEFRSGLDANFEREFDSKLKTEARGGIRWTLPAIVLRDTLNLKDQVLALPSFGFHTKAAESIVRWEIRYKKVVEFPGLFSESR